MNITNASNTTPIVITVANHGLTTGDVVSITDVLGNTGANGVFIIVVLDANTLFLIGSIGSNNYISGGILTAINNAIKTIEDASNTSPIIIQITTHGYINSEHVRVHVSNVTGATNANGTYQYNVIDADNFELVNTIGNGILTTARFHKISSNGGLIVSGGTGIGIPVANTEETTTGGESQVPHQILNATNTSPIVIHSLGHGLINNQEVTITGIFGNTAANGTFVITVINSDNFSLNGSTGNGGYIGGGTYEVSGPDQIITNATNALPIVITSPTHGLLNDDLIDIIDVKGNLTANGMFYITVIDANNFSLNGSIGTGDFIGDKGSAQLVVDPNLLINSPKIDEYPDIIDIREKTTSTGLLGIIPSIPLVGYPRFNVIPDKSQFFYSIEPENGGEYVETGISIYDTSTNMYERLVVDYIPNNPSNVSTDLTAATRLTKGTLSFCSTPDDIAAQITAVIFIEQEQAVVQLVIGTNENLVIVNGLAYPDWIMREIIRGGTYIRYRDGVNRLIPFGTGNTAAQTATIVRLARAEGALVTVGADVVAAFNRAVQVHGINATCGNVALETTSAGVTIRQLSLPRNLIVGAPATQLSRITRAIRGAAIIGQVIGAGLIVRDILNDVARSITVQPIQGRLQFNAFIANNDEDRCAGGNIVYYAPIYQEEPWKSKIRLRIPAFKIRRGDATVIAYDMACVTDRNHIPALRLDQPSPVPFAATVPGAAASLVEFQTTRALIPADIFICWPSDVGGLIITAGDRAFNSTNLPRLFYLNWFSRTQRNNGAAGNDRIGHELINNFDMGLCLKARKRADGGFVIPTITGNAAVDATDREAQDQFYLYLGTVIPISDGTSYCVPGARLLYNRYNRLSYSDWIPENAFYCPINLAATEGHSQRIRTLSPSWHFMFVDPTDGSVALPSHKPVVRAALTVIGPLRITTARNQLPQTTLIEGNANSLPVNYIQNNTALDDVIAGFNVIQIRQNIISRQSTLVNGISALATSITVTDATRFPPGAPFGLYIDNEEVLVTNVTGAVFTIRRYPGAVLHNIGAGVRLHARRNRWGCVGSVQGFFYCQNFGFAYPTEQQNPNDVGLPINLTVNPILEAGNTYNNLAKGIGASGNI